MKYLICSDIHGDADSARKIIELFHKEKADKLMILGDILYHGPRNDLPRGYAPKEVISVLNEYKDRILCVRGNCDTEVDQMVLEFPILADYAHICVDGLSLIATHGHKYNINTPIPMAEGDILLHGHTHIPTSQDFGNKNTYLNPGSCAIPKGGYEKSYAILEDRTFSVKSLNGELILQRKF